MHDPFTIGQDSAVLFGENTTGKDFRQIFSRIAARIGSTKPAPKTSRDDASTSVDSQLAATQDALARAHVSLVQLGLELDSERHARRSAEANASAERRACEEAMHLLRESVQPLRDLQAAAVEHRAQSQEQAQAYSELESKCESLQLRLQENETALARALDAATRMRADADSERLACTELERSLEAERLARVNAETQAHAERAARVDAEAAVGAEQLARADAEARAHAEVVARLGAERNAQRAHNALEEAERRTLVLLQEADAQRSLAEQHALQCAELKAQREALESQFRQNETVLARVKYAAYRHAQRHAQMTVDLEKERRARMRAEAAAQAQSSTREEAG